MSDLRYIIFDTETTGLPQSYTAPPSDSDNWPRLVQLAWQIHDAQGHLIDNKNLIVRPDGFTIPFNSTQIHGITNEKAKEVGEPLSEVIKDFLSDIENSVVLVGHNVDFDYNIIAAELYRLGIDYKPFLEKPKFDTQIESTEYVAIPGGRGGGFKWPKLSELYEKLFDENFDEAHNAAADVNATARAFFELIRIGVADLDKIKMSKEDWQNFKTEFASTIQSFDIKIESQVADFKKTVENVDISKKKTSKVDIDTSNFFHFHNHSVYSVLTASTQLEDLVELTAKQNMPAVGITDHGNMMGAFNFIDAVNAINEKHDLAIVPIIGCEVYISDRYLQHKFTKGNPDKRYPQVLLAKNKNGYLKLSKISTIGYTDGFYFGVPRISREVVAENKEDIIATTGALNAEIPSLILNVGEQQAEEVFVWYKETFGEDFYVELFKHGLPEEEHANEVLLKFAKKHNVKVLAQNNTYYLKKEEAGAQDTLVCIRDGEKLQTPKGRGRGFRFGLPNDEYYFKSKDEMANLFHDIPEAITNFNDFVKKFEPYTLRQDVLLPKFDIPEEFLDPKDEEDNGTRGENNYLRHLTYEGAKERYPELTDEIKERIEFELDTIRKIGYPGYFLIVQDFTSQARKMNISVGPGRGSAAGSVVAYCTKITNIDPIKYDLLFERFLNPGRISLPDIDIDFDDRGRDKIIQWVIDKYGKDNVSQIITYGKLSGKSAMRDAGRVMDLPLSETDRIAKRIPDKLNKILSMDDLELSEKFNGDLYQDALEIKRIYNTESFEGDVIKQAKLLEGAVRNVGVHACGVIITPKPLIDVLPMATAKDSDLLVTQFDNNVVENAGLLKMDFLGLKTLTIIKDACDLIYKTKGVKIDPDEIPLDDKATYDTIFKTGRTVGIFQYESEGMQVNLKSLQPDKFADLIAMNALYRPGPMAYIPNFVNRKHGKEEITYDLPEMEEFLEETYGITVYQEQVIQLSQKLASFTKSEADTLRKAMGKKLIPVLNKMKPKFMEQAIENGHSEEVLEKIWSDWVEFTKYAFNKSHSTSYAYLAFQTAYLKTHYPAQFMAATLSNKITNIADITTYMQECKRMGIAVLSPSVNESMFDFTVSENGAVRFGLGAIKGVGHAAVEEIIREREENGVFTTVFNFMERINLKICTKKTIENCVYAGAFDDFKDFHRAMFFYPHEGPTNLEKLIKFGQATKNNGSDESQVSLFDTIDYEVVVEPPEMEKCEEMSSLHKLSKEKEVVGIYISAHPLDKYEFEINNFIKTKISELKGNEERYVGRSVQVAGIVTNVRQGVSSKNNSEYAIVTFEDYSDTIEVPFFGETFLKFRHFLNVNQFLCLTFSMDKNKYSGKIYKNITSIDMLADLIKNQSKYLNLQLSVNHVDKKTLSDLVNTLDKYKGDVPVRVFIQSNMEIGTLSYTSNIKKVDVNHSLIDELKLIEDVTFSLN